MIKTCDNCNNEFEAKRATARYCSERCKKVFQRVSGEAQERLLERAELVRFKCEEVPLISGECVYFLWDDDIIVYIGRSSRVITRVSSHVMEGEKKFNAISIIPIDEKNNQIEALYIKKYAPKYNTTGITIVEKQAQRIQQLEDELCILKYANTDNPDVLIYAERGYPVLFNSMFN